MANSPKYHELCGAIISECHLNIQGSNKLDKILRSYLEACAEELKSFGTPSEHVLFRAVLGLGDVEASVKGKYAHINVSSDDVHSPKESPKQEWCEHLKLIDEQWHYFLPDGCGEYYRDVVKDWDICPVKGCHAPRPKSLTTQERLAQYLYEEFQDANKNELFDSARAIQHHYMELSGKVINWIKENQ